MSIVYSGWLSLQKDYQAPGKTFSGDSFEQVKDFFIENQVPDKMIHSNVRYFDAIIGGTPHFLSIHTNIVDADKNTIESDEIISYINSFIRYYGLYGSITKCFKEPEIDELLKIITQGASDKIINPHFEKRVRYLWDEVNSLFENNNFASMHHLVELVLQNSFLRTKLLKQAEQHPYFAIRMENNRKTGEFSFESLSDLKSELQNQGVPAEIAEKNSRQFNFKTGSGEVSYQVEIDFV